MRILIVNDDGINAPGLTVAEELATALAGPAAEIWVVAPERERSGASHAVSYVQPMRITQVAERRFAVDGFPADCALAGLRSILRDTPPDLVISGVNRGHNVAEDVVYSGTVGAAMDAALAGVPAVAMSQCYGRGPDAPADVFDPARAHGVDALRAVLAMPSRPGAFYNVNFPAVRPELVRGLAVCRQGLRADATFDVVPHVSPSGREFCFLRHSTSNASAAEGTDARLMADGWIAVTPLACDLTADDLLEDAAATLRPDKGRASV